MTRADRCRGPGGEPIAPAIDSNDRRLSYSGAWPGIDPTVVDFDEVGTASLATSTTLFTPIVSWTCAAGNYGVGLWFGQDVDVSAAYQDVRWRLVVAGRVVVLYPAIIQIAGLLQDTMTKCHVFLGPGQKISVEGINANVTTRVVRARVKGLYRPISENLG